MGSQLSLPHGINKIKCETQLKIQETQLSQRGRAMLGVSEYFTKPLKVTENRTIRNLGTVFHSRCIAVQQSPTAKNRENREFNLPHLHSTPPLGVSPSEYCQTVWCTEN